MKKNSNTPMLGIIGGLGPMATAYFMELIISMTDAATDQEHIRMLVCNYPDVPDRTKYILGNSTESPLPYIEETGAFLRDAGATCLAIPCITAHYFHDELEEYLGMRVEHIIRETVAYLKVRGINKVGIMATDGTVQSGLFQAELKKNSMEAVLLDAYHQKMVMDLIYEDVKAGRPIRFELFEAVAMSLKEQGAEVSILGCTELSMIKKNFKLPAGILDAMEVLSMTVVNRFGLLKEAYRELITK